MLQPETIATIKATAPVLAAHGEELTRHFYRRMFEHNPEVREFFNPAHQVAGTQQRALAGAICAFAAHVDNLPVLASAVELIAQKHASLGVKREHYPIVGTHLLASIGEVLGAAASEEILAAWNAAYAMLAEILIARETALYAGHQQQHGWEGFKRFRIARKEPECDRITSFYLAPNDGTPLCYWSPGQYVTVRTPAGNATAMRNYSLSGPINRHAYRISVKREDGDVPGVVSNHLHECQVGAVIEVAPPCGEFVLGIEDARKESRPLVFLAGGVGATPLLSMIHAAVAAELRRDIYFIHGVLNRQAQPFAGELSELGTRHSRMTTIVRYSEPSASDIVTGPHSGHGFIDIAFLKRVLPTLDCDYYLCGPKGFMAGLYQPLIEAGVDPARLRMEFFGPKETLNHAPSASVA